ncbi:MAG: OmpA family protein [Cyclobacteriaceae bacterium]
MRSLASIAIPLVFLSLTCIPSAFSQFKSKKKKQEPVIEFDTLALDTEFNIYDFKNVNRIREYFNKQKLEHIVKLEKEKNWPKLYYALKDYIKNFAIRNFYVDTYWIWRLAKLTELYGTEEEARSLYKLVLRHHHESIDIQEIEIYYDSLNTQMTDLYVPLDYYYKLVEHRKAIDTLRPPPGVLLNMGRRINSRKADYGPTLGLDDDVLIYTSQRNESKKGLDFYENEDLFFSTKKDGFWTLSEELKAINSEYNEGSACLSRDKKTLYFSRCESPAAVGNCDIFMATMQEDSTWGNVVNLGFNVNSISWDSHPALSHTEDTLYFASDRIGGFGLSDIYYTNKTKDGWAKAQNLGPVVNTRKNDVSPFYHPKYDVLYFSSNGQLYSFGEFDIYKAYKKDNKWSEPVNIGPLVNGPGNEFYFTIDSDSRDLYYSRSASRDLEKQDLYSFPLPMGANPNAITKITGSLTDSLSGKPFTGIVSIIDVDQKVEVAPKYLKSDGSFEFDLVNNRNYLLVIQGDEFFRVEEMFYLEGPMDFRKVTEPIASRVKFESIEFDIGQANLKTEMYGDLNKIVNFMYDNLDFFLKISGHTDSFGASAVNLKLSKERAKTIRDYIVIFGGVDEERVSHEGYGSSRPLVEEVTEEDKKLNRRVEFEIYRPAVEGSDSE